MANGTTRTALAQMQLRGAKATEELNEEMKFDKKQGDKMPLKAGKNENNRSK